MSWLNPTLAALVAGGSLGACGSTLPPVQSNLPNIAQIQNAIQQSILARDHVLTRVFCPTQVPLVKDEKFSCVAVGPRGRTFIFSVTETGAGDLVSYQQTG
jgi:hypothetical protein